jgi:CTP-dependent riboflavin kinase
MARQYFKVYYDEVDCLQFRSWSKAELLVWIALKRHENKDHKCWPGYRKIQSYTGLSSRSIAKAIEKLEWRGAITKTKLGRGNYYEINES